jgi:hypothetical protein
MRIMSVRTWAAANPDALEQELSAQRPRAHGGMLQMLLIEPPRQRQIGGAGGPASWPEFPPIALFKIARPLLFFPPFDCSMFMPRLILSMRSKKDQR